MRISRFSVFLSVFFAILICVCYEYSHFYPTNKTRQIKEKQKPYYIPISIPKISELRVPLLPLRIENQTMMLKLGTGFAVDLALPSSILDTIEHKKYLFTITLHGMFDTVDRNKVYEVPEVNLGSLSLTQVKICEGSEEFFESFISFPEGIKPQIDRTFGIIGWRAFLRTNLFLDIGNLIVGVTDSLKTLQQNLYAENHFVKIPLLMDRDYLGIEVEGPQGLLRCNIDTASTINIIHTECKEGQIPEKVMWESLSEETFLRIGGEDFGPIFCHHFPIHSSNQSSDVLKIDAILGTEFLSKHILFLDFANGYAYLAKRTPCRG